MNQDAVREVNDLPPCFRPVYNQIFRWVHLLRQYELHSDWKRCINIWHTRREALIAPTESCLLSDFGLSCDCNASTLSCSSKSHHAKHKGC